MKGSNGKKTKKSSTIFVYYLKFFIVIYLVCTTVFSIMLLLFVSDYWENQKHEYLHNTVDLIATIIEKNNWNISTESENSEDISKTLSYMNEVYKADIFIVIPTSDGYKTVFCSDCKNSNNYICDKHKNFTVPGEYIVSAEKNDYFTNTGTLDNNKNNYFIAAQKAVNEEGKTIAVIFAVQPISDGFRPYINSFLTIYFVLFVIILFIMCLLIYVFSYNRMVKPLKILGDAADKFTQGDFSYRINIPTKHTPIKELESVQYSFNSMAEALEQLEKRRNSFIANASHELKTPMTTISGFIDGMLDGTINEKDRGKYLKIISDEVKRLSRLVVSMLNISKIESGELRLNVTKVNLTELIIKIFIGFEKQIENKHITVKGLETLKNIDIDADTDMINQVFYNLIDNAVKFTDYAGTITVNEFFNTENATVTFSIINTGRGIEKEDIDNVFERFFKGDKSRSLDSKSSGLGLFIVKNIIKLHNGDITVDSIPNNFTEFKVTLKEHLL